MGPAKMENLLKMLRWTSALHVYSHQRCLDLQVEFWLQKFSRQLRLHHSTKQSGSSHGENWAFLTRHKLWNELENRAMKISIIYLACSSSHTATNVVFILFRTQRVLRWSGALSSRSYHRLWKAQKLERVHLGSQHHEWGDTKSENSSLQKCSRWGLG